MLVTPVRPVHLWDLEQRPVRRGALCRLLLCMVCILAGGPLVRTLLGRGPRNGEKRGTGVDVRERLGSRGGMLACVEMSGHALNLPALTENMQDTSSPLRTRLCQLPPSTSGLALGRKQGGACLPLPPAPKPSAVCLCDWREMMSYAGTPGLGGGWDGMGWGVGGGCVWGLFPLSEP